MRLFRDTIETQCRLHTGRGKASSSEPEYPERPDHHVQRLPVKEEIPISHSKNRGVERRNEGMQHPSYCPPHLRIHHHRRH